MVSDWQIIEEPSTAAQRQALYRLGLSRNFVHQHVKTKEQAAALIAQLLESHAKLRKENAASL